MADFGYKKLRIGVQQKDGSYVPPTASTVGTEITITQSGGPSTTTTPNVTTCKTQAGSATADDDPTASFCTFTENALQARLARTARQAKVVRGPVTGNPPIVQAYFVEPGATVTIEQTGTNAGYVADPASPVTVAPCEVESGSLPFCDSEQVVLEDGGLPPVAKDDSATTDENTAVGIAIATNDTPKAPVLGVTAGTADHGTVRLIAPESADPDPSASASSSTPAPETSTPTLLPAAAGARSLAAVTSYRAVYTPKAGFTGTDHFDYTIRTANGTATATVVVTVVGVPASSSASASASVSASESSSAALADTGTQSNDLVGYAAVLLAAGGGALALGRQRRRGRHAR